MKKAIISVFALFLCVCLLYPGIAPVAYADDLIHADDTVISIPSLDDDFADNRVMVVLTREASLDFHAYTASDFADIGCAKVTDLSDATAAIAKSALEQAAAVLASGGTPSPNAIPANHQMVISNYKQVLCLELNAAGKKNVIAAIKLLSQTMANAIVEGRQGEQRNVTDETVAVEAQADAPAADTTPRAPMKRESRVAEEIIG